MRFQFASVLALAISAVSAAPLPRAFFEKTEQISSTIFINAPVEATVATLHDFELMIRLNPLVQTVTADLVDSNKFTITDSVPLFLGLSLPTSFTSVFEAIPAGMNTDTDASAGLTLRNEWRAVPGANGGTDLTETDFVTANRALIPFIVSQIKTSHDKLMATLRAQLEGAAARIELI